jgi:hypothetical protein
LVLVVLLRQTLRQVVAGQIRFSRQLQARVVAEALVMLLVKTQALAAQVAAAVVCQ